MVVLADLAGFLETDSGLELAHKNYMYVPMKLGDVLWSPFGYLILPLYMPAETQKEELAFMWHLTTWSKASCGKVSDKTWAAVAAMNDRHHVKVSGKPVWGQRAELFKLFCAEAARRRRSERVSA